ncbi:alcohol dehydrogenase catalytic domain-containing protein [Dyella sp. RRB7]|uniref:alcohol dehydrogenase catalytic domain-containing protein n=1 Tax=Dyella sp. RRB7 TaxID=2919502 RepID=UPI00242DE397|nr:alcohol dehydrogenase catalytic domain-containing protein [Dyella sp. RRB7]
MRTVRIHSWGGPEVLRLEERPPEVPGPGEVRLRIRAIGLNRTEATLRSGRLPARPPLPSKIGFEAAGEIDALGTGVTGFAVGERVAVIPAFNAARYALYGEQSLAPARSLVRIPDSVRDEETLPTAEYVINRLNDYDLSHLLLMGTNTDVTGSPLEHLAGDGMFAHFRKLYQGTLIANVEMDARRAERLIADDLADMIAFGRPYIANPDLVERLQSGAPLNDIDWPTVYASGPAGYTDYPVLARAAA